VRKALPQHRVAIKIEYYVYLFWCLLPRAGVVKDLVPRGGTILDIGSHIGTLTVPFAKHVGPNGFVIAIESQRPIQALCQANAAINSLYNVRSINAAVDATRDSCLMTVSFDVDEFRNYGSHAVKECSEALMKACDGGRYCSACDASH
jgi:precorrin-6B methylase 2